MPRPWLPLRRLPVPRISFKRNRHRAAPTERDKFLFAVKIAAVVVLAGIVAGFVLLAATSGEGGDDVAATNPAVPTITDGGSASAESSPAPPPPTESVAAPAVGSQTAVLVPTSAKPPTSRQAPAPPPGRDPQVARLRQPCAPEGQVGFTRKFEPLVCRNGRWDRVF